MSELGAYALRFGLLIALLGLVAAFRAGLAQRPEWTRVAERAVFVVSGCVALAIGVLFSAFANCDYELAYVAAHSARSMALPYRMAALWGGQAGSLLLWLFILSVYATACVALQRRQNRTLMPWVVVVLLANATFFLVLLCFVTDPFERLPHAAVLSDGAGLNPLLQHPVMMIHPVMLYTGLRGLRGAVRLRLRGARDRRARRHLVPDDAALDADPVAVPQHRHHARRALGLRSARLGRLLGLGSGRERLVHALASRHRLSALRDDPGKAQHAEDLEPAADRAHLHAVPVRHLPDAQRCRAVRPRLRADAAVHGRLPRLRARDGRVFLGAAARAGARSCAASSASSRSSRAKRASCSTTGCSSRC